MATQTRNDDHLTLGDAIRSLDEFPDADGKNTLVRGQDVFDVLSHRGLLRDRARLTRPRGALDEIQGWLDENRDVVIDDDRTPIDELAQILARARVALMPRGTTLTAVQPATGERIVFLVVHTPQGAVWLAGADGLDRDLDDIDLTTVSDVTPPIA